MIWMKRTVTIMAIGIVIYSEDRMGIGIVIYRQDRMGLV